MTLPFVRRSNGTAAVTAPPVGEHSGPAPEHLTVQTAERKRPPKPARKIALPEPDEPDWYAALGLPSAATDDQIAVAYRRKAAQVYGRAWGGERALRNLKMINAAYEVLSKPERRADYDRRRAAWLAAHGLNAWPLEKKRRRKVYGTAGLDRPRLVPIRAAEGGIGALLILLVVGFAAASGVLVMSYGVRDLAPLTSLAQSFGLASSKGDLVAVHAGDLKPLSMTEPLAFATPSAAGGTAADQAAADAAFAGSAASVSDPTPAANSTVQVKLTLLRDGQPVVGAPVYALAHYRTVDNLRWPDGGGTVTTGQDGVAAIEANIGDATPGYEVKVDLVAEVDGESHTWTTSFTPQ